MSIWFSSIAVYMYIPRTAVPHLIVPRLYMYCLFATCIQSKHQRGCGTRTQEKSWKFT